MHIYSLCYTFVKNYGHGGEHSQVATHSHNKGVAGMFILTVETEDKKKLHKIVAFVNSLKGCNFSIEEVTEVEEIDESPIVNRNASYVELVAAQVVPRHLRDDTPYEIYAFIRGKELYVGATSIGADTRMQQHINAAKKTQDEFLLWLVEGMNDGSLECQ